jgi:hypothetical protein
MRELYDRGGPSEKAKDAAVEFMHQFAREGSIMEFKRADFHVGRTPELFNRLAESLAVLSWLEGGVTLFEDTWDIRTTPLPESGA